MLNIMGSPPTSSFLDSLAPCNRQVSCEPTRLVLHLSFLSLLLREEYTRASSVTQVYVCICLSVFLSFCPIMLLRPQ